MFCPEYKNNKMYKTMYKNNDTMKKSKKENINKSDAKNVKYLYIKTIKNRIGKQKLAMRKCSPKLQKQKVILLLSSCVRKETLKIKF